MATNDNGGPSTTQRVNRAHPALLDPYHISSQPKVHRKPHLASQNATEPPGMMSITEGVPLTQTYSQHSDTAETASTLASQRHDEHGHVRTLPVWIESFEVGELDDMNTRPTDALLSPPSQAHSAQHHYNVQDPSRSERRMSQDGYVSDDEDRAITKAPERGIFGGVRDPVRGRKWDFARDEDPVIISKTVQSQSPWVINLMKSSMYGPAPNEDRERVDYDFLANQTPGYEKPWRGDADDGEKGEGLLHNKKERRMWYKRMQHTLLMHPLVPLAFRVTVLTTSIIALGISSSVYALTHRSVFEQTPSTLMAIVVDVIAIPYILYITWDEYTGKPLGLRSPKAKIRLVLLDLFFIVFESANLAIAFANISDDTGSCRAGVNGLDMALCRRVRALVSFLLVALVAWIFTFAVSIFRLVERVGGREEGD